MNPSPVESEVSEVAGRSSPAGQNALQQQEPPPKQIPLDMVVSRAAEVSTLPHIALKVMEVARNPESNAADLKTVVESDPSLSARVLRTMNSAAYAFRSKVTNLQQAISLLGFNQVRNLAITASVSDSFKNDTVCGTYRRSGLWRHLVSVGICARLIAARTRLSNFEDAFLAGLLHDFGIIIEDQHVPKGFRAMINSLNDPRPLTDAEQMFLGFDHTLLGARVADNWKFPLGSQGGDPLPSRARGVHGGVLPDRPLRRGGELHLHSEGDLSGRAQPGSSASRGHQDSLLQEGGCEGTGNRSG